MPSFRDRTAEPQAVRLLVPLGATFFLFGGTVLAREALKCQCRGFGGAVGRVSAAGREAQGNKLREAAQPVLSCYFSILAITTGRAP